MAKTAFIRASERIRLVVRDKALKKKFARMARSSPIDARNAMRDTVTWWFGMTAPRIPSQVQTVGGGILRKSTQPWIEAKPGSGIVRGGIRILKQYGIWLVAGTRLIAGGAVLRWKPGMPLITTWPAKSERGGGIRQAMPIALPWQRDAQHMLRQRLVRHTRTRWIRLAAIVVRKTFTGGF